MKNKSNYPMSLRMHDLKKRFMANKIAYVLILPFFSLFFLFTVIPVFVSVVYSFTYYNMLQPASFVGLSNYFRLFFSDDLFRIALKNTMVLAVATGPISYIMSFLVAWFINEVPPKIRALFVFMFYAPSISGNAALVWTLIFSSDSTGLLNGFLLDWGFINQPILWFQEEAYIMPLVILVSLWMGLGTGFLTFVAGLQGIDTTLYEAGAIDGLRNRWQELWYITLPSMLPQLIFGAVLAISGAFSCGALGSSLAGNPSTNYAIYTITMHMGDYSGARFEMGYASAIATVLTLLTVGTNKIINSLLKKVGR